MRTQIEKAALAVLKNKLSPQLAGECAAEIADAVESVVAAVAADLSTAVKALNAVVAAMDIDPKKVRRGKKKVKGRRGRPPGSGRGPGRPRKVVEAVEPEDDYEVVSIDRADEEDEADEDLEV